MDIDPMPTDRALCLSHISDEHLLSRLAAPTGDGACVICAGTERPSGQVVTIGCLATVVYDAMLRSYDHDGWHIDGEQLLPPLTTADVVAALLADAIQFDAVDQVTDEVVSLINQDADWFAPYDMDEEAGIEFEWNDFEESVKHESRMLSPSIDGVRPKTAAEKNYVFVKSLLVLAEDRMGLVRTYERGAKMYRARTERDARALELKAKKAPARELGAAPRDKASAGRMNVQGVSMFYVALDAATACAEVATHSPYDEVVVGTFVLQEPLRILDLTSVPPVRSVFDDTPMQDGDERLDSLSFYVDRITKPVILDGNHPVDYAPTQVITDAMREWTQPRLDGIAYPSRVSSNKGTNVVLFYSDRMWFESPNETSSRFERMVREVEHGRKTSLFHIDQNTVRRHHVSRQITVERSRSGAGDGPVGELN